jgi:hypothetical protein
MVRFGIEEQTAALIGDQVAREPAKVEFARALRCYWQALVKLIVYPRKIWRSDRRIDAFIEDLDSLVPEPAGRARAACRQTHRR